MRVAVLCPTRDRPERFQRLCDSVKATSSEAVVRGYVDEDQVDLYPPSNGQRFSWESGPRVGVVAALNHLVRKNPGFDAYGILTDDCVVNTPGWDYYIGEVMDSFPRRLCVVSPYHNFGNQVDMPFVSKEWIRLIGWYACPNTYHYCWPIITGLIGEMTAICHCPMTRFGIEHDLHVENKAAQVRDAQPFFEFVSLKLPALVERIREAMK